MTRRAMLARGGGVTVWRQIAEAMEADIVGGGLPPGSRMPTEAALSERFGVNRHTVRQALKSLVEKGLVRVTQGSGTYVEAKPLTYPIGARTRFSEIVLGQAREPAGRLIGHRIGGATIAMADALGLSPEDPVVVIDSAHFADRVPISWAIIAFPLPRFAGVPEVYAATGSISAALAACGVPDYRRATTHVGAAIADATDVERLEVAAGRPILVVESLNVDRDGVPIQWARSHFSADRVRITVGS
ncbi:phosphonate metabolism transcriptional regulator PhnF [Phreatobacter stygius]|uniref:Phosphonate metabolism transcriptional regulator PhnF n=1 Tax=Phreatobacter stygius TaxID=1940610 RepID=A0A4D7AWP3_9HYPH|nr:phosphonate metabolism transcriptional regulator PhnF [Phreatobacter stygius]QCI63925.1 phosphonate metabolism transcriptional regulator PhnF [Phreatobacter stygius]